MSGGKLHLEVFYGTKPPYSNASLLFSEKNVLLMDGTFMKTDARTVAKRIKDSGKTLTTILLTHSHPDHAWGAAELLKSFPKAKVYARPVSIKELELEFRARLLRWTGIFNAPPFEDELPTALFPMEPLVGDTFDFDGHTIEVYDSKPSETINLTNFYIPEMKTYVASDQIYSNCHYYVGPGLNRPDLWIESIEDIRNRFDIKRVVPGHGAVGGPELFDEAIEYLTLYDKLSKPLVPQVDIVNGILKKYPDLKLPGVLIMTIGPAVTAAPLMEMGKAGFGTEPIVNGWYKE